MDVIEQNIIDSLSPIARRLLENLQRSDLDEELVNPITQDTPEITDGEIYPLAYIVKQLGREVWELAIRFADNKKLLDALLEDSGYDINYEGGWALFHAITCRRFDHAQALIDAGADINAVGGYHDLDYSERAIEWRANLAEFLNPAVKSANKV